MNYICSECVFHTLSFVRHAASNITLSVRSSVCVQHAETTHLGRLFPDLKSATLTPGVSVQAGGAILPLKEISTCCLGVTSTLFCPDKNQSGRQKPSSASLCVIVHTHCSQKIHALTRSHIRKQKDA